jgi:hypothetical protein
MNGASRNTFQLGPLDEPIALSGRHAGNQLPPNGRTVSLELRPHLSDNDPEFPPARIAAVATSQSLLPRCFESVRLDQLVARCLDMTFLEEIILTNLFGKTPRRPQRKPEGFYESLREAIDVCRLGPLFAQADAAQWHRSIVPAAYNERSGGIYPVEMSIR